MGQCDMQNKQITVINQELVYGWVWYHNDIEVSRSNKKTFQCFFASSFQPCGSGKFVFDIGCEQHGEYHQILQVIYQHFNVIFN